MTHGIHQEDVLVNGHTLHTYQCGEDGEIVILLHGGGTDAAMLSWRKALPALGEQFRVYALDWPGYGKSDPMAGIYSLDALITTLSDWMDTLQIPSAHLVGLSMGGGAALGFALLHPQRVQKLVAVDTYGIQNKAPGGFASYLYLLLPFLVRLTWSTLRKDKGMTRAAVRAIFADADHLDEELVEEVFEAIQNPSGEQAFYAFQRHEVGPTRLRTSYLDQLHKIQSPTLFIHGDTDKLVPLALIQQAAASMPDARLAIMEKTGHWPPREHPDLFNQLVTDFLSNAQSQE